MLIETLQAARGHRVLWEKFNLNNGKVELLQGTLVSAGIAPNIGNVEYAQIEDPGGKTWITLASQVKEILP